MTVRWTALGLVASTLITAGLFADTINLAPALDNSMYELCGEKCPDTGSNGAGEFLFAGPTFSFGLRRALLEFDIAGNIPAGSTINSATLRLHLSMESLGEPPTPHALHRVTASWGEGASDAGFPGGDGVDPEPGDASWNHRFFPGTLWTTPGGDFNPVASATTNVDNIGFYNWSSAQLTADVQNMLDNPANNHGWILRGNEAALGSARRYDSRENSIMANRPVLMIDFTPGAGAVPTVSQWGLLGLTAVLLAAGAVVITRRTRKVSLSSGM